MRTPEAGSTASLIAQYRELVDRLRERWQSELQEMADKARVALVSSRDEAAIAEWLCSELRSYPWLPRPSRSAGHTATPSDELAFRGELRGFVLRGGQGGREFPADNPWSLPPAIDLAQAIRHVWAPGGHHASALVDTLVEVAFAVAMVRDGDSDYLAYLFVESASSDVAAHLATASIEELMSANRMIVGVVWGAAPLVVSDGDTVDMLGEPLPEALRALAAAHRSLSMTADGGYVDLENLEPHRDGSNYIWLGGGCDHGFVLDLKVRDESGHPTLVDHDPNDGILLTHRRRLWDLFSELHEMLNMNW